MLYLDPAFHQKPADPLNSWVSFGFHAYFLGSGLISGVILDPPLLLVVSMLMAGLALYLHRNTWLVAGPVRDE